jgi:hypothetical protein
MDEVLLNRVYFSGILWANCYVMEMLLYFAEADCGAFRITVHLVFIVARVSQAAERDGF